MPIKTTTDHAAAGSPPNAAVPPAGVVVIDMDGESHLFPSLKAAAGSFDDGAFRDAFLLGESVEARLRSLLRGA